MSAVLRSSEAHKVSATDTTVAALIPEGGMEVTLNEEGMICWCDFPAMNKSGYRPSDLIWHHISVLLPELEGIALTCDGEINPRLRFFSRIGRPFQMKMLEDKYLAARLFIRNIDKPGRRYLRAMIFPVVGWEQTEQTL